MKVFKCLCQVSYGQLIADITKKPLDSDSVVIEISPTAPLYEEVSRPTVITVSMTKIMK